MKGTQQERRSEGRLPKQGSMKCIMKEVEFGPLNDENSL